MSTNRSNSPASSVLRILLVEDSADDAELVIRTLERDGYSTAVKRVETAEEMTAALANESWDAVLSDYSLPTFDAPSALRVLQNSGRDIPFIIVSGTVGEETAVAAMKAGAHDYIVKHNMTRLSTALDRSLRDARERRERANLETALHQAQKMEVIGQLAGGIAHDFNNQITAIRGFIELALEGNTQSHARRSLLAAVDAADRSASLTRQLLTFSRRQVLNIEPVDVNAVVTNISVLLERVLEANITCELRLSSEQPVVMGDVRQLENVLTNLAVNARDAMPNGGHLYIATELVAVPTGGGIGAHAAAGGRYLRLSMTDTGVGMTEATKARLFEPFFTTKEVGRGTGLGLATVYGIVDKMGGHIEVSSEIGRGATFRLYLPTTDEPPRIPSMGPRVAHPRSDATILVVDDDDGVREFIAEVLSRRGYRVLTASTGREAREHIARADLRPDLLLADVVLPDALASDFSEAVRESGARVVFMSGYSDDRVHPHNGASVVFLEKPFSTADLLETVAHALSVDA